jgi:hypothetical protein
MVAKWKILKKRVGSITRTVKADTMHVKDGCLVFQRRVGEFGLETFYTLAPGQWEECELIEEDDG